MNNIDLRNKQIQTYDMKCIKSVGNHKEGFTGTCYVQKMSQPDNRYMVYGRSKEYSVITQQELNESFEAEIIKQ